jgi:hypothetical protein
MFEPLQPPILVRFGNNDTKIVMRKSGITFELIKGEYFTINGVLYILGITKHLLFTSQTIINGIIIEFHSNHAIIIKYKYFNKDLTRTYFKRECNFYSLKCVPMNESPLALTCVTSLNLIIL